VVLACIGLFGLALFSTQRRVKEIGIRKVLGASVMQILVMFWKDFSRPIVLSLFCAVPVAWYLMKQFLSGYIFHTDLNPLPIIVTVATIVIVGFMTVSFQSLRAARTNPADTLKTE
jgi:putative ABC transport system permease protein